MFFSRDCFKFGDGCTTRFLEDTWLGDTPLAVHYPTLYNIVQRKEVFVRSVLGASPLNIQFRRALIGDKWIAWLNLVRRLMAINLTNEPDSFHWWLHSSGVFSVKSMYADLINTGPAFRRQHIWKTKVPLNFFMWFVYRGVILTKDNLAKRRWQGSKKCCFCDQEKTNHHLFYFLPVCHPPLAYNTCSL